MWAARVMPTEPLAREIGRRADARALLLASVRRLGELYVVEMRALDPERDEYLFTVKERAPDKAGVLDLVDRLSERTRVALREPRAEVATRQVPVGVAVTSNLEAHAHYFRAQQVMAEAAKLISRKSFAGRFLALSWTTVAPASTAQTMMFKRSSPRANSASATRHNFQSIFLISFKSGQARRQ